MTNFNFELYLWCVVGIVISVMLPVLWAYTRARLPSVGPQPKSLDSVLPFLELLKPYLALGLASAATALLLIAFLGDKIVDYKAALLAGYAWDSTLQKLR